MTGKRLFRRTVDPHTQTHANEGKKPYWLRYPLLTSLKLGTALTLATLLGGCGKAPAPSFEPRPNVPALSLCGTPTKIDLGNKTIVMKAGERVIINENYLLEYAGATTDGRAIFNIISREDGSIVTTRTLSTNRNYALGDENGNVLLTFAVCSVNAGYDFVENSVTLASDRELDPFAEGEDGGVLADGSAPDAGTRNDSETDSNLDTDAGIDARAPDMGADVVASDLGVDAESLPDAGVECAIPPSITCTIIPPETTFTPDSYTIYDPDTGLYYTVNSTDMTRDGIRRYTVTFESGRPGSGRGIPSDIAGHRGPIFRFLGQEYAFGVVDDSRVILFEELEGGAILNTGEHLTFNCYRIELADIVVSLGITYARIHVIDPEGTIVRELDIAEGQIGSTSLPNGDTIFIKAWRVAPGYTPGARWASISISQRLFYLSNGGVPVLGLRSSELPFDGWTTSITRNDRGEITSIQLSAPSETGMLDCR